MAYPKPPFTLIDKTIFAQSSKRRKTADGAVPFKDKVPGSSPGRPTHKILPQFAEVFAFIDIILTLALKFARLTTRF